jgi:hypothetical protein
MLEDICLLTIFNCGAFFNVEHCWSCQNCIHGDSSILLCGLWGNVEEIVYQLSANRPIDRLINQLIGESVTHQ